MAASSETVSLVKPKPAAEEWTVVLPRRGKKKSGFQKKIPPKLGEPGRPWAPVDTENDPERELKLMKKMHSCIEAFESSRFYQTFLDQIQCNDMADLVGKVLGSEEKMPMVIYGIGSIESFEPPRLQLGLAVLMKRNLSWIGDVEVFDPVISSVESKVLSGFGVSVLAMDEDGRRQVSKPTLFFMPHCEAGLYNNLLQANWEASRLNQIVLLGNSFDGYKQAISTYMNLLLGNSFDGNELAVLTCNVPFREETHGHIFAIRRFTKEFAINAMSDDYYRAFHSSSWHFFDVEPGADLQLFKG